VRKVKTYFVEAWIDGKPMHLSEMKTSGTTISTAFRRASEIVKGFKHIKRHRNSTTTIKLTPVG